MYIHIYIHTHIYILFTRLPYLTTYKNPHFQEWWMQVPELMMKIIEYIFHFPWWLFINLVILGMYSTPESFFFKVFNVYIIFLIFPVFKNINLYLFYLCLSFNQEFSNFVLYVCLCPAVSPDVRLWLCLAQSPCKFWVNKGIMSFFWSHQSMFWGHKTFYEAVHHHNNWHLKKSEMSLQVVAV